MRSGEQFEIERIAVDADVVGDRLEHGPSEHFEPGLGFADREPEDAFCQKGEYPAQDASGARIRASHRGLLGADQNVDVGRDQLIDETGDLLRRKVEVGVEEHDVVACGDLPPLDQRPPFPSVDPQCDHLDRVSDGGTSDGGCGTVTGAVVDEDHLGLEICERVEHEIDVLLDHRLQPIDGEHDGYRRL